MMMNGQTTLFKAKFFHIAGSKDFKKIPQLEICHGREYCDKSFKMIGFIYLANRKMFDLLHGADKNHGSRKCIFQQMTVLIKYIKFNFSATL